MNRAWVLHFDAELELEAAPRYTATREMEARLRGLARDWARTMPHGDVVLWPSDDDPQPAPDARTHRGAAWCPTPRALEVLRRAGLSLPDAPSFQTLRGVHERGFAFALAGDELPSVLRATELGVVEAHVAGRGPTGGWLLKRGFGVAGRGQRPVRAGVLRDADRAWIAASLRRGALYVEPEVDIRRELSVHAWARTSGTDVRSVREQHVGRDRAFVSSVRATSLAPALERALIATTERVGAALIERGYLGPFGVDAYLWRTTTGALALRALSEVNPRYCMGWDDVDGWD